MSKILYVTTVSLTMNTFFIPHIKHLIEIGHNVDIACSIDVPISKELLNLGVKLHIIDFSRNPLHLSNVKAYKQIAKVVEDNKYDIVHVHTPVASFVTRFALRKKDMKVIYTAHGFHFYKGAPLINWLVYYPLERIASRWTDKLVTINTEDLERAKQFSLRNKGKVTLMHGVGINSEVYNLENFNRDEYRNLLGLKKDDFVILVLAEINKNKNHIQIIKAIELLKDKYPNIKLICAGKGPLENELKNTINSLGLNKQVKLIGFRKDVVELLHSCDCVGLFSYREGLGKCLLEGMIAGVPMIATNTRGPRELIESEKNGFLVELGDYENTAKAIEKIYIYEKLRENFIKESQKKVKLYYMENVLDEIEKYYENSYGEVATDVQ